VVTPPELKSGDLPAAALKILYSPAVEKGINDAEAFTPTVDGMVYLFAFGFGVEKERSLDFVNLPLRPWIRPYVHINESSVMSDLAIGVQNGFISKKTASERAWFYATSVEWERLMEQKKMEEQADLLAEYEKQRFGNTGQE